MTKIFHIEGIGDVKMTKYKRSRKIKILVNAKKEVKVTMPYFVSYNNGLGFVREKIPWIIQTQAKMVADDKKNYIDPDYSLHFLDKTLHLKPHQTSQIIVQFHGSEILILYPYALEMTNELAQLSLKKVIIEILRKEAKKYLSQRVEYLANYHGFEYSGVAVKNLRSRWGSCSGRNNINLNLHLIRLPGHLIDYVILHELVHTKHKNHSIHFWNALSAVLQSDARLLRKEMRAYRPEL